MLMRTKGEEEKKERVEAKDKEESGDYIADLVRGLESTLDINHKQVGYTNLQRCLDAELGQL